MPRFRHIDNSPRLLPVDLERQLLPGTFEYALNYLVDHELDLAPLTERYANDAHGAPAFPPGMLLSPTSSRRRRHVSTGCGPKQPSCARGSSVIRTTSPVVTAGRARAT